MQLICPKYVEDYITFFAPDVSKDQSTWQRNENIMADNDARKSRKYSRKFLISGKKINVYLQLFPS